MSGNDVPPDSSSGAKPGGPGIDWKLIGGKAAAAGLVAAGITFLVDGGATADLFGIEVPSAVGLGVAVAGGSAIGAAILQTEAVIKSGAAARLGQALEPLAVAAGSVGVMYALDYVSPTDIQRIGVFGGIAAVSNLAGNKLYDMYMTKLT